MTDQWDDDGLNKYKKMNLNKILKNLKTKVKIININNVIVSVYEPCAT